MTGIVQRPTSGGGQRKTASLLVPTEFLTQTSVCGPVNVTLYEYLGWIAATHKSRATDGNYRSGEYATSGDEVVTSAQNTGASRQSLLPQTGSNGFSPP